MEEGTGPLKQRTIACRVTPKKAPSDSGDSSRRIRHSAARYWKNGCRMARALCWWSGNATLKK